MNFLLDISAIPTTNKKKPLRSSAKQLRFIDLFAGLGGFHVALESLGAQCLFAAEKDLKLNELYKKNFSDVNAKNVVTDITKHDLKSIPEHDILCAGFPCQPFSKAGKRKGMKDPNNGGLFNVILDIIDYQKKPPRYLLLENVPNILTLDNGKHWSYILSELKNRGYSVDYEMLSPHEFGIPQNRKRIFIVASLNGLREYKWPQKSKAEYNIEQYLKSDSDQIRVLTDDKIHILSLWQEFLNKLENQEALGFPIWATEFGATYPVDQHPLKFDVEKLRKYKGSFGQEIVLNNSIQRDNLPIYVRDARKPIKAWKASYINKNRILYENNKSWLNGWKKEIMMYPHSLQKFEWNCQLEERIIEDKILQFRPSGVRIKSKNSIPTLVAMNMTQVPYFPWLNRYLSIREGLGFQGLSTLKYTLDSTSKNYRALGNAVNADIVRLVSRQLLINELSK